MSTAAADLKTFLAKLRPAPSTEAPSTEAPSTERIERLAALAHIERSCRELMEPMNTIFGDDNPLAALSEVPVIGSLFTRPTDDDDSLATVAMEVWFVVALRLLGECRETFGSPDDFDTRPLGRPRQSG